MTKKQQNGSVNIVLDRESDSVVPKDIFRSNLVLFQEGLTNLDNGAKLLNKILKPTPFEMGVSLLFLKFSEKLRLKRLMNLDLEATQRKLIKKANSTINALKELNRLLEKRHKESSETAIQSAKDLEKCLNSKKKLETEEVQIKKEVEKLSNEIELNGSDNKDETEIKKVAKAKELFKLRKKLQDNSLKQEQTKAQIKSLKSMSKNEGTHAEYSYNMLRKLLPIQELITSNKDILHNRIEMLNRMIAAGAILKPIGEVSEELNNVSSQFSEANAMMNKLMEDIKIIY